MSSFFQLQKLPAKSIINTLGRLTVNKCIWRIGFVSVNMYVEVNMFQGVYMFPGVNCMWKWSGSIATKHCGHFHWCDE